MHMKHLFFILKFGFHLGRDFCQRTQTFCSKESQRDLSNQRSEMSPETVTEEAAPFKITSSSLNR